MSTPEVFDDDDKHIKYSPVGGWISGPLAIIPGVPPEAAGATLHAAVGIDCKATISFHGTGIQVFGVSQTGAVPTASYILDNDLIDLEPESPPSGPLNVSFFSKQGLEQKTHELVITVTNLPEQYLLDYVIVSLPEARTSDSSPTVSGETSASPTATLPSLSSTGNTTSSAPISNAPTSDDSTSTTQLPGRPSEKPSQANSPPAIVTVTDHSSSSTRDPTSSIPAAASTTPSSDANASASGGLSQEPQHTNTAAIVGGVLGVLLVIALVVIYAMIRRRRKSRSELRFPDEKYTWRDGRDDPAAWNEPSFPEPTPLSDTPHQSTFAPSQLPYETSAPVPVAPHAPYSNPMVPDYPPLQPHRIAPDPFRQPRHPAFSRDQDAYASSAMT